VARRSLTGVLLMDAVISSGLLALVAFFVLSLLPSGSLLLHQGRFRGHALQWAQSLLESLDRPGGALPVPGPPLAAPSHQFEGAPFQAHLQVSPVAGEAPDKLVQASCTVAWSDALGQHQLVLGGYLAARN